MLTKNFHLFKKIIIIIITAFYYSKNSQTSVSEQKYACTCTIIETSLFYKKCEYFFEINRHIHNAAYVSMMRFTMLAKEVKDLK